MTSAHFHLPNPASIRRSVGFGSDCCKLSDSTNTRIAERRRRREILEACFSPVFSEAALPSAVDRLILWRSRHGRHCH